MSEIEGKFGHPCYRSGVECHRGTGAAIEAVFKPKIEGDGDGWHRASMEYVAYKLSRMLGMDLVPPAAYRTGGIELDYKTFDEGAFMYWVDDAKELEQVGDFGAATRDGCWGEGVDPRVVLSDTRVLDVLLQNSDRHSGHFLFGRHWTEGLPRATESAFGARERGGGDGGSNGNANGGDRGSSNGSSNGNANGEGGARDARFGNGTPTLGGARYLPCLIDHAASFRPEAFVSMEHENAFQTGPTVRGQEQHVPAAAVPGRRRHRARVFVLERGRAQDAPRARRDHPRVPGRPRGKERVRRRRHPLVCRDRSTDARGRRRRAANVRSRAETLRCGHVVSVVRGGGMKAFGEGVLRGESTSRGVSGVMNREAATAAGDARIRVQSFDRRAPRALDDYYQLFITHLGWDELGRGSTARPLRPAPPVRGRRRHRVRDAWRGARREAS